MPKLDTIYIKLPYSSSKVEYFAAENRYYDKLFPELKRSLEKMVNLGFSVLIIKFDIQVQWL